MCRRGISCEQNSPPDGLQQTAMSPFGGAPRAHRGCLGATDFSAVQENRPLRFSLHGDSALHVWMGCAVVREIPCCPEPKDGKLPL